MATVLYIKANAKPQGKSRTFQISEAFIEAYIKAHPNDSVVTLDLYKEGIQFLTEEDVCMHVPADREACHAHPVCKYAHQFVAADRYVFADPLWNLGIPAILKAYIDYVTVAGITFMYTAEGPVGLCQGKKAINITTRGGVYAQGPAASFEMGDRYLRTICGFLGIKDYMTIYAEGLDVVGQDVDDIVAQVIEEAQAVAKKF